MQRVKPRMSRRKAVLILIAALAAAGLLTWGILSLVQGQQTTGVTATRLPCPYDENIKAFGKSSQEFAEELIRGAHVICVPGTAFGAMGEGYLRLVFANSDENLEEAVRRIDEYVRKAYPDMK